MKKTIALFAVIIMVAACKKSSPIIDKSSTSDLITDLTDPGINSSIKIGTQKWMATNLAVSRYRNGDRIPQVRNAAKWAALTTGAWCWYNNDSAIGRIYGKLYNWYAVTDPRGLAPIGWHIPSDAEWTTLTTYLGGAAAGGKLKATGTIEAGTGLWYDPNGDATNSSAFTGLPGGARYYDGAFYYFGYYGQWWSSSEFNTDDARGRSLTYLDGTYGSYFGSKRYGYSVRCVRD